MKHSAPTWTSLIEAELRGCDDFRSRDQLQLATGCARNQAGAALFKLREYRVVDVIVDPAGKGWWYALPPDQDTRQRTVAERVPESRPRKPHKRRHPRAKNQGS